VTAKEGNASQQL